VTRSIHTMQYARLRNILSKTRKSTKMTQAQLAKLLGRPQSFVSKIESGERRLDVIEFVEVCQALGLAATELIGAIANTRTTPRRTGR